MGAFSIFHWLIVLGAVFLVCWPTGRILRRLGFSPWWSLLSLAPLINLIALWVFAYRGWPREPASN